MAPGTPPRAAAPDGKAHVKRFIDRVVDDSPEANVAAADIVNRNLQQLPPPERRDVLDGLVKEAPKLRGIQHHVREHQAKFRRATRRDEQLTYLDKAWGGRQNWAHPTFMPRITESVSISTTAPLTTMTKLALKHQIALPDLWQPGGELHDAAFTYGEHILTKDKAGAALRAFKSRIGELPQLDARDETDYPQSASESESEPESKAQSRSDTEQDRTAKRPKHVVERSPSVEGGRRERPPLDHSDGLFSPGQEIHLDDDGYVALDVSSPYPRLSPSPIRRSQSYPSSILDGDGPAAAAEGEISQTTPQRARQQLQDPTAQLTDDVLNLLLQHITRTSRNPGAKVLDPLYVQVDSPESHQPPAGFSRVCESKKVIYIPLHHKSQGEHWSLAVLRPEQACIEHYDSLHSGQRETQIQGCFESILDRSVRLSRMACPQQQDSINCGVFVVCFLGFLLNKLRFPTSLDPSPTRQKLLNIVLDPEDEPSTVTQNVTFRKEQREPAASIQGPETASMPSSHTATKRPPPKTVRTIPQVRERITQLEIEIDTLSARLGPLIHRNAVFNTVPRALAQMEEALNTAQPFGTPGSFWQSEEEAIRATNLLAAYGAVENLAGCDPQSGADEIATLQTQLGTAREELRGARDVFRELANASLSASLSLVLESRRVE
ncbi:Sentrin sumo-specific [Fusarium mexicanum]|uniref:Sentrin sumo-specific n=1 Tax=Fusarium mexicanum TaxID=751941 RepID=A0A8H5I7Y0_9HYPO|nr:Sentrin sumo-specific [Fusarium mexicanum]